MSKWQKSNKLTHPQHGEAVVSHTVDKEDEHWVEVAYPFSDGVIYNYDLQSFHEAKGWQKVDEDEN